MLKFLRSIFEKQAPSEKDPVGTNNERFNTAEGFETVSESIEATNIFRMARNSRFEVLVLFSE